MRAPKLRRTTKPGTLLAATPRTERAESAEARELAARRHIQLNALQRDLLASGPLDGKLKKITDAVVRLFDADFCRIWLSQTGDRCESGCVHAQITEGPHVCRHRDQCLHLKASSGRYTLLDGAHGRMPFACYRIGQVASAEAAKFVTNDVAHDPEVRDHEWVAERGLVSFAGYQLRPPGGKTVGVLALFARHPISPEEDSLLEMLGLTAAQVVHQAQAEAALRESEERYRSVVDNVGIGVALLGPGMEILAMNRRMRESAKRCR